jgi:hypothetical protein
MLTDIAQGSCLSARKEIGLLAVILKWLWMRALTVWCIAAAGAAAAAAAAARQKTLLHADSGVCRKPRFVASMPFHGLNVFLPAGKEAWLRGSLGKWLMHA